MAMAEALGCADTFHDERPGGHEGIDHAECEVDGTRVQLYVLDDAAAKERWIREVAGYSSEEEMEQLGGVEIRGSWAVGSRIGADVAALADRLEGRG